MFIFAALGGAWFRQDVAGAGFLAIAAWRFRFPGRDCCLVHEGKGLINPICRSLGDRLAREVAHKTVQREVVAPGVFATGSDRLPVQREGDVSAALPRALEQS